MSHDPVEWLLGLVLGRLDRSRWPMAAKAPLYALVGAAWGVAAAAAVIISVERWQHGREVRADLRASLVVIEPRP